MKGKSPRKVIVVLSMVLLLAMGVLLAGCGGSDDSKFVGTWKLTGIVDDGEEMDMSALEAYGYEFSMVLDEDHTFSIDVLGSVSEGTWEAKSSSVVTLTMDGSPQDAKLSGNTLTMEEDDTVMTFTKS
ncbi:MAG: lipocalin family protein [Clostridiales Family XIII bacterium]|jgi:hypothetical protein|nr:lipocalin family protein [Clostridiales Family XIII bacterium]